MGDIANDVKQVMSRNPYETQLEPETEQVFRNWVTQNNVPYDLNQTTPQDYDMRGYFKGVLMGTNRDPVWGTPGVHFPDTYKTPYHKSFSRESKYAPPDAPRWVGNNLIDKHGRVVFSEPAQAGGNE